MGMAIGKICVIGAGTMGSGIAQASAQAGYQTAIVDIEEEFIGRGMNLIRIGLAKFAQKGKIREKTEEILARIQPSTDLGDAAKDADYVIEAVHEKVHVKLSIFRQLDDICSQRAIFASNTSGIPISLLASGTSRPDRFIGMHFVYPVPIMPVVEVVRSLLTSDETLNTSLVFAKSIGKRPFIVKDSPGFLINRILTLVFNEAAKLLEENPGSMEDIDKLLELALGWPIGPFRLMDVVGIDVVTDASEEIYRQTGWGRYKPAQVLKRMVESRHIGRKAGKGFYELFGSK